MYTVTFGGFDVSNRDIPPLRAVSAGVSPCSSWASADYLTDTVDANDEVQVVTVRARQGETLADEKYTLRWNGTATSPGTGSTATSRTPCLAHA